MRIVRVSKDVELEPVHWIPPHPSSVMHFTMLEYGQLIGAVTVTHRTGTADGNINVLRSTPYSEWCARYEPIEDEL